MALFPSDRSRPASEVNALQVSLSELSLARPRQWGACWLANRLWRTRLNARRLLQQMFRAPAAFLMLQHE